MGYPTLVHSALVTHYSEASLMPLLVNKLIFKMIPEQSPFFIRPLLRYVFAAVNARLLDPRLKTHADFVSNYVVRFPPD